MDPLAVLGIFLAGMATTGFLVVLAQRRVYLVHAWEAGLLYRKGAFVQALAPGRYRVWRKATELRVLDLRQTRLTVPGQEILTADHVTVKISLLLGYRIADPRKVVEEVVSYLEDLHQLAQVGARDVVGGLTTDQLLAARADLARQLQDRIGGPAARFGVVVEEVAVRDVMLSAEVRRTFNDVLQARQEGLAALERARGETAALRSLANAARMLEDRPALFSLRLLQTLATGKGAHAIMNLPPECWSQMLRPRPPAGNGGAAGAAKPPEAAAGTEPPGAGTP